jgi:1-acyl-sn-glycerol-3-phosphate acyltransferase
MTQRTGYSPTLAAEHTPARAARAFRALRTGFAFAVFGVGALVVAGVGFPLLHLLGGTRDARERRAQWLVHQSFRLFVRFMTALDLIRVTAVGLERLRGRAALVVANHPTLIDVVLLIAAMPQADCVVKRALWRNRFLRGVVAGAGYVPNSDGPELVETCVARLRAGRWLLLFPEGTRSPRGALGEFRRGAAHIALRAECDVVPVVITCEPPMLMKGQPWYVVPPRAGHLTLTAGEPLRFGATESRQSAVRGARDWTADIRSFYEMRLGYGSR